MPQHFWRKQIMRAGTELNFNDGLARWSKWKNPSQADALRILGPSLQAVCLDANVPAERAAEWMQSQSPETITAESVRDFVRSVTEIPTDVLAAARAKQAQLNREVSAPLAPDTEELSVPIGERSRAALEARIAKIRWYMTKASCAEVVALEDEMDKRDCAIDGIPWEPRFRLTEAGERANAVSPGRAGY
jgi:hypothetical protein